ncbi:DNA replication/repair protein RecF [Persicobacter psychrovividus]|uniref:DNA replication and repair protein RecF n=1 Tax=Persicobacter psychrovividus TaxID=387638 RepID=A0ABN6L599_9BACT|nr:DNA replication and repair protein RecF [Persicobacter psychrovividus]
MFLSNIQLLNFKNYEEAHMVCSPQINCLVGENGSGKTNMLDAIHYLSLVKSAFAGHDQQSIKHQSGFFSVMGSFDLEVRKHKVLCGLQAGAKKVLKCDQVAYDRLSDHIGRFPVVLMAPHDTDLIREGSEERRRFFDTIICQLDQHYLQALMNYSNLLKQRNALLRQCQPVGRIDEDLLATYDHALLQKGQAIAERRQVFVAYFEPLFQAHYRELSGGREAVALNYRSEVLTEGFGDRFRSAVQKDLILGRTTLGVHRDDLKFSIDGHAVKRFGSQGQQKSFVIALKLAQFDVLQEQKGFKPILLLDDIFDKLDDQRMHHLLSLVADGRFGQIFITDARPERTKSLVAGMAQVKVFRVDQGKISEEE